MQPEKFTNATKIQRTINTLKEKEAVFQSGHWSSAENFEAQLRADGFTPAIPISHTYKFPESLPEKECEDMAMWLIYIIFFNPVRIYDAKKYVEMMTAGTQMTDKEKNDWYDSMMQITGELNDSEKEQIVAFFERARRHAPADFAKLARNLQKLNPEVADAKIDENSVRDLTDLVIGMTSRFHPDDIKYCLTLNDMTIARKNQQKFDKLLGYSPHLFIEPKRVDKIINGIIMQRNMQMGRQQ